MWRARHNLLECVFAVVLTGVLGGSPACCSQSWGALRPWSLAGALLVLDTAVFTRACRWACSGQPGPISQLSSCCVRWLAPPWPRPPEESAGQA